MTDATPGTSAMAQGRSLWVVLCPGADGRPGAEYVEGTEAVADRAEQVLQILDGGRVVREYPAGGWSNFSEWVSCPTDYFAASAARFGSLPEPRQAADQLPAGPMRMDPMHMDPMRMDTMRMDSDAARSMLRSRGGIP